MLADPLGRVYSNKILVLQRQPFWKGLFSPRLTTR